MKRTLWLLVLGACLMAASPRVQAAQSLGSLRVTLDAGDLPVTNGTVTLYQVGIKTEEGYRITEAFGGGTVKPGDADSKVLAQWLAETADASGIRRLLDADGTGIFPELEEGLYMLVQTERMDGFYPIQPTLLTIPEEECWDVQIYRQPVPIVTEIPKTGQSPIPFFGVLGMILSGTGLVLCSGKYKKR